MGSPLPPIAPADASAMRPPIIQRNEVRELMKDLAWYRSQGATPRELDEYVLHKTNGQFPSAQAFEQATSITPRNVGRSLGQGATMGWSDELMGLVAAIRKLGVGNTGKLVMNPSAGAAGIAPEAQAQAGQAYGETRDAMRQREALFRGAHPVLDPALQAAGGAAAVLPAALAAGPAAGGSLLAQAGRGAMMGAGAGAMTGAGMVPELNRESTLPILLSTALGGAGGAAIPGAVGLTKALTRGTGGLRLARAIDLEGGPAGLAQREAEMAAIPEHVPADLGPNLQRAADFAVTASPEVAPAYEPALAGRAAGMAGRMRATITKLLGTEPDARAMAMKLDAVRARIGDRMSQLGINAPNLRENPILIGIVHDLSDNGLLMGRARLIARQALERGDYAKVNELRKLLRGQADAIMRNPSATAVKADGIALYQAHDALDAMLAETIPGYPVLQSAYARAMGLIRANGETAADFLGRANTKELQNTLAQMTQAERNQFRYALASGMVDDLSAAATNRNVAARLIHASADERYKLRVVFGSDKKMTEWMDAARHEYQMSRTMRAFGGSQTAGREAEANGLPTEALRLNAGPGHLTASILGRLNLLNRSQINRQAANQMAPLLLQPQSLEAFLRKAHALSARQSAGPFAQTIAPTLVGQQAGSLLQP